MARPPALRVASGGPERRRPALAPAMRRLWRDATTLQLGRSPGSAVVLGGLDPATRGVITLLDGTRDPRQVVAEAAALGCPAEQALALLRLLDEQCLLQEAAQAAGLDLGERERLAPDHAALALLRGEAAAEVTRRRLATRVRVVGAGRVGAPLAAMLCAAGIGAVDVLDGGAARPSDASVGGLVPDDTGRRRDEAAAARARACCVDEDRAAAGSRGRPDLVVLAPVAAASLEEDLSAVPPGVPHLLAEVREAVGVVGPLVVPGSTACLHCLDLTRTDLDPGWPAIAAQLASPHSGVAPADGTLAVAVASQACLQLLSAVDGGGVPATADGTLELAPPDWRWRRRSWRPHPDCHCDAA